MNDPLAGQRLWSPSSERVRTSGITAFIDWLRTEQNIHIGDYPELWRWSISDIGRFWEAVWQYYGITSSSSYRTPVTNQSMPGATWFEGATLNLAQHLLRQGDLGNPERPAIFAESECHQPVSVSWSELREQVVQFATYLRGIGVRPGDHVAAYLPISVEAVVAMLATISIGAVWSSCSPDFGARSVLERFAQVKPKVLIGITGYRYNGKAFDRQADLANIVANLNSLEQVVYLPWSDNRPPEVPGSMTLTHWSAALRNDARYAAFEFEQVAFAHPVWVLYTSGTTGLPKGIIHSHGGMTLEFTKFGWLHDDLKPDSVKFFFTSTGWTMFNLLVGGFATGCAIVVYDGCPTFPNESALWEMADRLHVTYFGASPTYLNSLAQKNYSPKLHYDLSRIRTVAMTGSPVSPENFAWIYDHVGSDIHAVSMSGGTDVASAFVAGASTMPVYAGEIQVPCLGVDVCVFDESGERITNEEGELVIRQPMPSMPIHFLNDPDGERYKSAYFEHYPNVWRQGDQAMFNERMGCVISGRSDATLNRYGIRIGTAEIYRTVDGIDGISDSLIVNLELPDGQFYMPMFITLQEGYSLDEALQQQIKMELSNHCSPRHVPDDVFVVPEIPYTLSGKKQEIPVKKLLMGKHPDKAYNRDACANPDAMNYFIEFGYSRVYS